MTHDVEARLKAAYAPLHPDPARAADLAHALDEATQAPPTRPVAQMLPWGVAIAATLVGAFLIARRPGPSGPVERPAHDGPAVTAFVDARGRTTIAGVDGRALRTWELGELPIGFATPADIGKLLASEVAPFAPPADAGQVPRLPDVPVLGPLFQGPSPVALVLDAAADVAWRHVESVLIGAAQARLADIVFLDPTRAEAPISHRLPLDARFDGRFAADPDLVHYRELEFPSVKIRLRPDADDGVTIERSNSGRPAALLRDATVRAWIDEELASVGEGTPVVELEVLPGGADGEDRVTYGDVFRVLGAVRASGGERVLFAAGAGRRQK